MTTEEILNALELGNVHRNTLYQAKKLIEGLLEENGDLLVKLDTMDAALTAEIARREILQRLLTERQTDDIFNEFVRSLNERRQSLSTYIKYERSFRRVPAYSIAQFEAYSQILNMIIDLKLKYGVK